MDTPQTRRSFYSSFTISSQNTLQIHPKHDDHSTTHSDFSNPIQTRYAPDTAAILSLIQIQLSTTSLDTLQTRMSFWSLHQQFDSPGAVATEVIMSLIQIPVTVRIHPRHGGHSTTYTDLNFRYSLDTLQTQKPFYHSFRPFSPAQRCSRHGCHSAAYSDFRFRYNTDTLQTRQSFWYLFNVQVQLHLRYASDTDAILLLIQTQSPDTVQMHSKHG